MADEALQQGSKLGAFVIEGTIGKGGMGEVYRARNTITGEPRALKVIRNLDNVSPEVKKRFIREMRIAASINHPNVVRVFEPSMDAHTHFLPMELLEGESLRAHLRDTEKRPLRLAPVEAVSIMKGIAQGVGALHALGIVHRDLKPENVMLVRADDVIVPKVIDLGIALEVDGTEGLTAEGHHPGTPRYMSPEQVKGCRDLDARTDVFAMGVMLYEMLGGRRPYEEARGDEIGIQILLNAPFPSLCSLAPNLPPALADLVARAMAFKREARFADGNTFAAALHTCTSDEAPPPVMMDSDNSAQSVIEIPPPPHPSLGRRVVVGVLGLVGIALGVGLTMKLQPSHDTAGALVNVPPPRASAAPTKAPQPAQSATPQPIMQRLSPAVADDASVPHPSSPTHQPTPHHARRPPRCRPRPGIICPPSL